MTSLGKYRHLTQTSTPGGHFVILAIDHRANLRATLDRFAPAPLTDAQFAAFKQQVMRHLLPHASAVLVDPAYGFGPGIADGTISGSTGVLSPLEVTDYDLHPSQREVALIEGWSIGRIKRFGGAGVKLLLFYHPDAPSAAAKRETVARVVEECARHDVPFFLEPIAYALDPERPLSSEEKRQVVIANARTFSAMGIDVLKIEFPVDVAQQPDENVWREALADLDAACAVPWALLSAGVDYATFKRQAELACEAGASGVIVGRAVWAEATRLQGQEREAFLRTTAAERMSALAQICARAGRDWRERVAPPDTGRPDWYLRYADLKP